MKKRKLKIYHNFINQHWRSVIETLSQKQMSYNFALSINNIAFSSNKHSVVDRLYAKEKMKINLIYIYQVFGSGWQNVRQFCRWSDHWSLARKWEKGR